MTADSWLDIAGLATTLIAGILFGALLVDALVAEPIRKNMWHWRLEALGYARRAARAESNLALSRRQHKLVQDILTAGEPSVLSERERDEFKAATDFLTRPVVLLPSDPRD